MWRARDLRVWVAVVAIMALAVFAIGGAPRWALSAIALTTALSLGLTQTSRRRLTSLSPLIALLGGAAALTVLQLVPLPAGVLAFLNPVGHALVVDSALVLGRPPPAFHPLSLDPPSTLLEAGELAAYVGVAYLSLWLASSERGRLRLLAAVAVVCAIAAGVAVASRIVGAETLYGLYRPRHASAAFLGPLLNPNHLGGLLAMGALVSAGLASQPRLSPAARLAWLGAGAASMAVCLLTRSRGAALALALGAGVLAIVRMFERRRSETPRERLPGEASRTVPTVVVLLCGLTLIAYFSAANVAGQLRNTRLGELDEPRSKYAAWRSAERLMIESPWVGVGRGGFETAFTRVHPTSSLSAFTHLENEYLQAAIDWGLPGACLIMLGASWCVVVATRRLRDGPAAGAFAALTALAIQSFVDFGAELPGIAVPAIVIAATLTYVPTREVTAASSRRAGSIVQGLGIAALAIFAFVIMSPAGRGLHVDHERLAATSEPSLELAREVMERHPLDYLSAGHAAAALMRVNDPRAVGILNHALRLHPTHPGLHRLAARMLHRTGHHDQARVEYALALGHSDASVALVREIVDAYPSADDAVEALPPDVRHPHRLARILIDLEREDVLVRYLRRVIESGRHDPKALELVAHQAQRLGDLETAEAAAVRLVSRRPTVASRLALARIQLARGDLAAAEQTLERLIATPGHGGDLEQAYILFARLAIDAGRWTVARERLLRVRSLPSLRLAQRRENHERMAVVEEALGNDEGAESERRAARALR